jgi:hypothetical protein
VKRIALKPLTPPDVGDDAARTEVLELQLSAMRA